MTPVERHAAALAEVQRLRGEREAGAVGPWWSSGQEGGVADVMSGSGVGMPVEVATADTADAALIVGAVNLQSEWLTAAEVVLGLHRDAGPSQGYFGGEYTEHDHCCSTCGSHGEYGEPWPCATVAPFLDVLGLGE